MVTTARLEAIRKQKQQEREMLQFFRNAEKKAGRFAEHSVATAQESEIIDIAHKFYDLTMEYHKRAECLYEQLFARR